jgi:hypothetical protein
MAQGHISLSVSDPGDPQPSRPVNFIAMCPCPDGLAQDGTQGGMYYLAPRDARSRGYKRREREREPVRLLVPRATPPPPQEGPGPPFYRCKERVQMYNGGCSCFPVRSVSERAK